MGWSSIKMIKSYYFEAAALLVITILCSLIFFKQHPSPHDAVKYSINTQLPENQNRTHAVKYSLPSDYVSQCTQSASAEKIPGFSSLSKNIQDFLYYRHCRHFPMLLDVPDLCGATPKESADVFLLIVIKTPPGNYMQRDVLRKTWAKERLQNGVWVRRVFLCGVVGSGEEQSNMNRLLQLENDEHHDILQWDFVDSFYNLTVKQVLFLEWMEKRCPHVQFMLNGDDDVFANTDNMVEYLQSLKDNGSKHLFVGYLIEGRIPHRNSWSKYYVPYEVDSTPVDPPFCGGGGFLLSGFTAKVMYKMSPNIPLHPIDDVFLAWCLKKGGLVPGSHFGVKIAGLHLPSEKVNQLDPCYYREVLLVHRFVPHEIYSMWNAIHDPNVKCGK